MFESINEAAAGLKNGSQTGKSGLSVDAPILLFPLRTEVKFMDNELLVRVYPEAIAIEQHEEQLTKAECQAGIWYWENLKDRVEKEIKPKSTHLAIWKTISDNFGAQRAEWIVQQCRPQNWEESPDGAGLKFPKLSTKKESWSQPHTCRVMPQELTICLQADQGKMIRIKSKNTIPEKLQVGPDPQKMKTAQKKDQEFVVQGANNAAGDFSLAGEIAWMTDFEEAVKKGVGFRIPLPEGSTRIEWLFVFGVKTVDQWWTRVTPSEAGLQEVLRLLRSHYYTPAGLSLMPQGEPTKNTEQKSTASALPLGFEKHHFTRSIQSQEPAATAPAGPKSDQQMLADALGIPFDSAGANELKKLRPNYSNYSAGSYDYHEAQAMNTALFPATVGYFTELVLGNPFGAHQAEFRDWFNQFVTGRGPLPVLKRGNQPYAVLPVTYFPDLAEHQNFPIFQRIAQKTDESLEDIILNSGLSDISTDKDMAEKLANILFQHPASVRHWLRFAWLHSTNYRAPELKIDKTPILKTSNGEELDYNKTPIEDILSNYFDKLPATDFGFQFTAEALVELPLVTSQALSEEDTLPTYVNGDHPHYFPILDYKAFDPCNYIEWIRRYYIIYCGHELREEIPKKNNGQLEMLDPFRGTLLIGESTVLARYLMHAILSQVHKCAVLWLKEQGDVLVDRFKDIVDQYRLKDIWPESNVKTPFVPLDIVFAPLQGIFKQPIINDFTKNINDFFSRQDPFQKIRDPKIPYEEFVRRITVAEYIYYYQGLLLFKIPDGWTPALRRELEYLETLKSSLNTLAQMPTARLERCLVEHFDVLSYRMDAWRTAFCFEKLSKDRQLSSGQPPARPTTSKGLHIGAYGWLLNIVRDETKRSVPADDPALQALGIDKAVEWKSGGGFVHAPSLDQAKAGAILKSAHTRFKNLYPDHPEMFAVNLSSARVRQGLYLLEGIQQGQDLGILLGYQFEREMHDGGLDHLIQEFRKEYSYQAGKLEQFGYEAGQENLATAGTWPVVDGLALLKAPPPQQSTEHKKISSIVQNLNNSLDALKDLLTAESVYQYTQNNLGRASAVLQAVSDLEVPPVLEFIKTPRNTTKTVKNRVAILFDDAAPDDAIAKSWAALPQTARAMAEPRLNHWVGTLLGDPNHLACRVCMRNDAGEDIAVFFIKAADLGLQALDWIYLAEQIQVSTEALKGEKPTQHAGATELEQRIVSAYFLQKDGQIHLSGAKVYIQFNVSAPGKRSFADCQILLKSLKEVISQARPMQALDFETGTHPYDKYVNYRNYPIEASGPEVIDIGRVKVRLKTLQAVLQDLEKSLDKILAQKEQKPAASTMIPLFWKAAEFGIKDAVVQIPVEVSDEQQFQEYLYTQAGNVLDQIKSRIQSTIAYNDNFKFLKSDKSDENLYNDRIQKYEQLIHTLFEGTVRVLPVFSFSHDGKIHLEKLHNINNAFQAQDKLLKRAKEKSKTNSNQLVLTEWLSGVAAIHPKVYALEMAKLIYESRPESTPLKLQLFQMTSSDNEVGYEYDTWLGGPLEPGKSINLNKASVVALSPYDKVDFRSNHELSGLIVDEWDEKIPNPSEKTALAINHDQALSHAPQALLLAVASVASGSKTEWSVEEVGACVMHTLTRAMMRGITPDLILRDHPNLGRLIPALYAEYMKDGRNITLNLMNP